MKSSLVSGVVLFLSLQVFLLTAGYTSVRRRIEQINDVVNPPTPRSEPLQLQPLYDYPEVVSDEQLDRVLFKLRPRLAGPKRFGRPKINHVDHALRFWGLQAEFDPQRFGPQCMSGEQMRDLLLDDRLFRARWGEQTDSLLEWTSRGVKVRTQEGQATASHVDHTLASLAEVGVPLDHPVFTESIRTTFGSMLQASLRDFSLNQVEHEWSALAYVLYLPPCRSWISHERQEITFDRLARRLMREKLNRGVCFGNHRLYTLTALLRVDDQIPILSPEVRSDILDHLQNATARLVQTQHPYGFWDRQWPVATAPDEPTESSTLANRVLAVGHALEWWAMAPRQVHPPREVLVRAGQWLCRTIEEMPEEDVKSNYTYLTHAGRALALWRGCFPWQRLPTPNSTDQG